MTVSFLVSSTLSSIKCEFADILDDFCNFGLIAYFNLLVYLQLLVYFKYIWFKSILEYLQ